MADDNELRISTYLDLAGLDTGLSEAQNRIQSANDKLLSTQKAAADAASEQLKSGTSWIQDRSNQILNITTAIVAQMKEEGAAVSEIRAQLDELGYSAGQVDKAFANYKEQLALAKVEAQQLEVEQEKMQALSAASAEGFAALGAAPTNPTSGAGASTGTSAYNEAAAAQYLALAEAENTAAEGAQNLTEATATETEAAQTAEGTWADFIVTQEATAAGSETLAGAKATEGVAVQNTADMWNNLYAAENAELAAKGEQVTSTNRIISANSDLRSSVRETSDAEDQRMKAMFANYEKNMAALRANDEAVKQSAATQEAANTTISQGTAKAGTAAYALGQTAQTAAGQVAQAFLKSGANVKDLGEDLKEMGFKNEQIAEGLKELGFTAEATGEKIKYSFLQARGAATLLTDVIVGGGPTSMAYGLGRLLASSSVLGPILQAAFPVIGIIAFADILTQIPEKIDKIVDKLHGWDKEAETVFGKQLTEAEHLLNLNDQQIQRQIELAGKQAVAQGKGREGQLQAEADATVKVRKELGQLMDTMVRYGETIDEVGKRQQNWINGPSAVSNTVGKALTPISLDVRTDEGLKKAQKFHDDLQAELNKISATLGQDKMVLDPIDAGLSKTTLEKNFEKIRDLIKKQQDKLNEDQLSIGNKQDDLRLERQRAETDEFVKQKTRELQEYIRVEDTKTANLNKDSLQRIAIAQAEVTKAEGIYSQIKARGNATPEQLQTATDAVVRAKQREAEVERQVDDARYETFKSTMEAQVQVAEQSSEEEVRRLRQTFDQVLGIYGSQSDRVKEVYNQIVDDGAAASRQEILNLMRVYGQAVIQYGNESKQAQDAFKAVVEARKRATNEQIKLVQDLGHAIAQQQVQEIGLGAKAAGADLDAEQRASDARLKMMDREMAQHERYLARRGASQLLELQGEYQQELANLTSEERADLASLNRRYQLALDALKRQMAVNNLDLADYKKLLAQKEALDQKYQQQRQKLEENYSKRREQVIEREERYKERLEQQFVNMWSREWDRMLWQAKSVSEALTMLWQDMVRMLIDAIVKWVGEWIAQQLIMLAFGQATTTEQSGQNVLKATSDAAVAADATLAWWSAVNPAVAPAMAAAQYGIGMMYAGLAAFEKGGNVPGDMLAYLHADEMVLPADIASSVRAMSAAGMAGGMKGGTTSALTGGFERLNLSMANFGAVASQSQPVRGMDHPHSGRQPDVHFHNAPVIQALDATSFDKVLKKHQATFTRNMLHSLRNGRVNINKLLRGR